MTIAINDVMSNEPRDKAINYNIFLFRPLFDLKLNYGFQRATTGENEKW